jgi:hypothetical protein
MRAGLGSTGVKDPTSETGTWGTQDHFQYVIVWATRPATVQLNGVTVQVFRSLFTSKKNPSKNRITIESQK